MTLLPEGQIPPGQELEAALKIVDAPINGGLEVGFLGAGANSGEITLRMMDSTSRDWLSMCGGMTQVVGKALVETFFRDRFNVDVSSPQIVIRLLTRAGVIPIEIAVCNGKAVRITSVMDDYAAHLYQEGVENITLCGCRFLRVGEFIIMQVSQLKAPQAELDFTRRDEGPHLDFINDILKEYMHRVGAQFGVSGMMYDQHPQGPGQFRIYPRFYSRDLSAAKIPYEFQCGTGTVAVGIAITHSGQIPFQGDRGSLIFEWGNQAVTPDPYGIRTSQLDVCLNGGRINRASFSHSVVEILQEGRITLPGYKVIATAQCEKKAGQAKDETIASSVRGC